jgi:hypothetical protein
MFPKRVKGFSWLLINTNTVTQFHIYILIDATALVPQHSVATPAS